MQEKYKAEVLKHLPLLLNMLKGKEYKKIADIIYSTVVESIQTVDERERNAAMARRLERNGRYGR